MKNRKIIFLLFVILFIGKNTRAQDWAGLEDYREANAKLELPASDEKRVVFMGNSIFENWNKSWPEFFSGKPYLNRGIGGQTSPQMLIRFRPDVINLKPAAVIILAGTNDIAGNKGPSTLEMILDNIISMSELAKANNIKVILCSVLPAFDYPWRPGLHPAEKIARLNEMIKSYADKNGIVYLDFYSPMVDERKGLKNEFTIDGVHPNEAGYRIMAPLVEEAIQKAFGLNEQIPSK